MNDKSQGKGPCCSATDLRIDFLCESFEQEWKQGNNPAIKTFLVELDKPARLTAFRKLLRTELEFRYAQGEVPMRSEYLPQFSDYQEIVEQVFELLDPPEKETVYTSAAATTTLRVRCPQCQNPVEILPETELHEINCLFCDSKFGILGEEAGQDRSVDSDMQIAQFTLIEQLGMGVFGSVWKALDTQLERTVAVKIPRKSLLDSKESEMFLREARAAAQLKHPNIVGVHEIGREDDRIYIVSDYVQGGSLAEHLQRGPLTSREAAELCEKIAEALEHAHQQGVIHRDLKPANILLDTSGNPLIADFGLAKREAGEITMTQDGQLLGTPAYMSPEQAQGDAHDADARSDVYSLGVILFELLTGEMPFRGSVRMLLKQVIEDDAPPLRRLNSQVPKDLETICLKCLEKDPVKRYQSALGLADDLRRFSAGEAVAARPISVWERGWRWGLRNRLVAVLAVTAFGLLFATAVISAVAYLRTSHALKQEQISATTSEEVSMFLENIFLASTPIDFHKSYTVMLRKRQEGPQDPSVRELLEKAARRIDEDLAEQPLVKLRLLLSIGNAYQGLGYYETAADLFREALKLEEELHPEDSLAISNALNRLAMSLGYVGDFHEAEQLARNAIALLDEAKHEHQMARSSIEVFLGILLTFTERFDEAEELLRNAISTRERLRGRDDESVLWPLEALAVLYMTADRQDEMHGLFVRTLQSASAGKTGDWRQAAYVIGDYQRVLAKVMNEPSAEAILGLNAANEEIVSVLGEQHPLHAMLLFNTARVLRKSGKNTEATRTLERAITLGESFVDANHPLLLKGMITLALFYIDNEEYLQAESHLKETIPRIHELWGKESWQSELAYMTEAVALFELSRQTEGLSATQAALSVASANSEMGLAELRPMQLKVWYRVASRLLGFEEYSAARKVIERGLSLSDADPRNSMIAIMRILSARIASHEGHPSDAIKLLESLQTELLAEHAANDLVGREMAFAFTEARSMLPKKEPNQ